jgi:ribosomal protein S18 acetylase RimI-like enzyme
VTEHPPHPSAPAATPTETALPIRVRGATEADLEPLVALMLRLKRLNEEFDPMLEVRPDAEARTREILRSELGNPRALLLAVEATGEEAGKVVGVVRATVRERPFYTPESEGVIQDIYLLPLYRRRRVGEYLLEEVARHLKERGAGILTAEFPTQNEIASRFYGKRGFRPVTALYARRL